MYITAPSIPVAGRLNNGPEEEEADDDEAEAVEFEVELEEEEADDEDATAAAEDDAAADWLKRTNETAQVL